MILKFYVFIFIPYFRRPEGRLKYAEKSNSYAEKQITSTAPETHFKEGNVKECYLFIK
jgi:hypothetical protein